MTEMYNVNDAVKLSARLKLIAEQVPSGSRLADIGSDHALLPVFLMQQGKIASAIAGEINEGPFQAACKQVRLAGLIDSIAVRQGDGLTVLEPYEADAVVIAGMGGSLIAAILEQGASRLAGVSRLILQPNIGEALVRAWLLERGWLLEDEHMLEEDGIIYELLVAKPETDEADRASNARLYETGQTMKGLNEQASGELTLDRELLMLLGPHQLRKAGAVFARKWQRELHKRQRIIGQLMQSTLAEAESKRLKLEAETAAIRRVLDCLPTDNLSFN